MNRSILLTSLAAIALSGPSLAQDQRALSYEDVFNFEMTGDPQISPNGETVVYTRQSNDIMTDRTRSSLWQVNYDGSNHRPLVTGSGDYSSARWSPDGSRLAFIASEDGKTFLRVMWMANGQIQTLAQLERGGSGLSWSPNGQHIAFTAFSPESEIQVNLGLPAKPQGAEWADTSLVDESVYYEFDGAGEATAGRSQLYVVSSQGGTPRQLSHITDGRVASYTWSDATGLVISVGFMQEKDFHFTESDLHHVTLQGEHTQLTDFPGAENNPTISPDGQSLAYLGGPNTYRSHHDANVYVLPTTGGEPREILSDLDKPKNGLA